MSEHEEVHEYRPSRTAAVALGGIFAVTAIVLAVLGTLLTDADVSGIDGIERLLFTVVPVRWFSWAMAAVFLAMGARVVARGFRSAPVLVLDRTGLTLDGEGRTPWNEVDEIRSLPKPSALQLRLGERTVSLSSFDLGDDPASVAECMAELKARRPPTRDPT
jgi:hypothetical protein